MRADSTAGTAAPAGTAGAVLDTLGHVRGWTEGAEKLLGHTAAEVVGRSAGVLLMRHRVAVDLLEWHGRAALREPFTATTELRRKDGGRVEVAIEASPLSGDGRTDWFVTAKVLPATPSGTTAGLSAPTATLPLPGALLTRAPVGLTIYDGDTRCVWANRETLRWDRSVHQRRLGLLLRELYPGPEGRAVEAVVRRVFETGVPVIEREYRWRPPRGGEEQVMSSTYFRLDGPDGTPMGVGVMATDINNSRGRRHLLMLSEASKNIGTTLDVMRTAQELADVAVPLLADYATVDLAESVALGDESPGRGTPATPGTPVFRRAGAASIHQGMPEALWRTGEVVFVPPSSPFTRALFSRESHFEPILDTSPGTWIDQDPERARIIETTGIHSLIIVPLLARGAVLGEAVFVRTDNPLPFSRNELLLLEELAGRAALSLDNARRFTRERAASLALQRHLLPQSLSGGRALDVASRYLPADTHEGVGGDWFDVIPLPGDRVALVVGDVVGHGINAAARMGQFSTVVRTLAELDLPPEELLCRLDRLVARLTARDSGEGGDLDFSAPTMAGTCLYAVYDPATGLCTMARAGHPPAAVVRPDGTVHFPDLPAGTPIGMGLTAYESVTIELAEGSTIALYTDGLVETRHADLDAGLDRLAAALGRTGTTLEELCDQVIAAMTPSAARNARRGRAPGSRGVVLPYVVTEEGKPSQDDIALLIARVRPLDQSAPASGPPGGNGARGQG